MNGSSPHTRGTQATGKLSLAMLRFIPAHAGNTSTVHCPPGRSAVHPRTRGEHAGASL